jgi:hypothetical protein
MQARRMNVANLSRDQLANLRDLEKELGVLLVALEPQHQLADLSETQLDRLQAAEEELGVVLLAYQV